MNYLVESVLITLLFIVLLPGVFLHIKKKLKLNIIVIYAFLFFVILFLINILFYMSKEGLNQKNPLDGFRVPLDELNNLLDGGPADREVIRETNKLESNSYNSLVKWLDTNESGYILAINPTKETATFLKSEDVNWELDDSSYLDPSQYKNTTDISVNSLFYYYNAALYIEPIRNETLNIKTGQYKETRKPYVGEQIGIKKNTKIYINSTLNKDKVKNVIQPTYKKGMYKTRVNIPDYNIETNTSPLVTKVYYENKKVKVKVKFNISTENKPDYTVEAILDYKDIVDNVWLLTKTRLESA
jgi:hypothetical protein